MTKFERMDTLLIQRGGILTTADAVAEGISRTYFLKFAASRNLVRVAHGIYLSQEALGDPMYLLQVQYRQAVFSHETALFLHDLTDREPIRYSVTVKTGYNPANMTGAGIKVYTVKKELHDMDITELATPFGHTMKTYNPERTVCDIMRSRNNIETQSFQDAMKQYARSKNKNLRMLMQYAKTFRIEKMLLQYMEVLL